MGLREPSRLHCVLRITCRRRVLHLLPLAALRAVALSGGVLLLLALLLEHVLIPRLQQQGQLGGAGWRQHNEVVRQGHAGMDRVDPAFPVTVGHGRLGQPIVVQSGVRSWNSQPVQVEKTTARRVLVLGDSFVTGSAYLTLNHQWWRQLALELSARGYDQVEVIAAGNSGFSTGEQLQLARQLVPIYQPDLIIWGYVSNDPDERLLRLAGSPLGDFAGQWVLERAFPRLMDQLERVRVRKMEKAGIQAGLTYAQWELALLAGENLARYGQTVAAVGQFQREASIPGLLVTLPNFPSVDHFTPRYAPVLPLWEQAGIAVCNLLPAFVARYGAAPATGPEAVAWGINPEDGHPGPRACRFFAVQTAQVLERDFPAALGPRRAAPAPPPLVINDWLPYSLKLTVDPANPLRYALRSPLFEAQLVRLPLDVPTSVLALQTPLPLAGLTLSGADLETARAWVSLLDESEGYDLQQWIELPMTRRGEDLVFTLPATLRRQRVSVIRLYAPTGLDRLLHLTLTPAAAEETPTP